MFGFFILQKSGAGLSEITHSIVYIHSIWITFISSNWFETLLNLCYFVRSRVLNIPFLFLYKKNKVNCFHIKLYQTFGNSCKSINQLQLYYVFITHSLLGTFVKNFVKQKSKQCLFLWVMLSHMDFVPPLVYSTQFSNLLGGRIK